MHTTDLSRRGFLMATAFGLAAPGAAFAQATDWKKLPDAEWRKRLSQASYMVLRHEATEPPGSSPLNKEKRKGVFACAGCGLELFKSDWKYESGTGWPSFWTVNKGAVGTKTDFKIGVPRKEYHCARCGGHQGHIFDDGPKPTGLRYCNNGLALKFIPA
ncbi:peptide-methionine (R)-S-oxide reductase MsrB [Phenylobacterium sp.]|jgi:peptide-methionine (R)-S-oxide reductase|uniref:peptide-methionine (R)-S-oxide reductase MsrB n=1 Tax=Phenylobacterium sp. TaxID=1871053 RepID=UPI002F94E6F8